MKVEVVYGLETEQYLYCLEVPEGTKVEEAIAQSPLLKEHPDIKIDKVGIFSKLTSMDTILKAGDRIEIYRPLKIDPRNRRREKVEKERSEEGKR